MKVRSIAGLALALVAPLPALAQTTSPHHFAVSGWLVSDYVFRGLSQTYENPAVQAAIDYTHDSGFYAGAWASPVDFNNGTGADVEVDLYAGFTHKLNESLVGDIQVIRYSYPGTNSGIDLDYHELIGKLTILGRVILTLGYSNDVFNTGTTGIYTNVTVNWALPYELTLATGVGHYSFDDALFSSPSSYSDYSVALSRAFGKLTTTLTYTGTNNDGEAIFGKIAEDHVFVSLKYAF